MILHRPWMILIFAGCLLGTPSLLAQDASGAGSAGGSSSGGASDSSSSIYNFGPSSGGGSGAASGFGLPTMPSMPGAGSSTGSGSGSNGSTDSQNGQNGQSGQPNTPSGPPGAPGSTPATSFGFPALPAQPTSPATSGPVLPAPGAGATPAATTFGSGTGGAQIPSAAPATFTVPGAYGAAAQTFTLGQGRLAKPRFRYTGSVQVGYDDNVLSSPTNGIGNLPIFETILVSPAIPAQEVRVPAINATPRQQQLLFGAPPLGATRPFVTVLVPGHAAVTETKLVFPGAAPAKRIGSIVARANVGDEIQFASRRTIFTMDLNLSANYYANRPGTSTDYTGSIALAYAYKLTSRLQFSASISAAYLTQPNLSVVNAPTRNVGNYLTDNIKLDLSYGWTHRFSTVTSITANTTSYEQASVQSSDYTQYGIGTEARYLLSHLLTVVGELRYNQSDHPKATALNTQSLFYLIGAEITLSRRLTGSLRVGEETGSFEQSGETFNSPYMELSASWRYAPAGVVSLTSRYGFEEPPAVGATLEVFRVGLNVAQALSSRLRLTASISGANRVTKFGGSSAKQTEQNLEISFGLQYTLTPHVILTANYDYLDDLNSIPGSNYYRNQMFLGAQYSF